MAKKRAVRAGKPALKIGKEIDLVGSQLTSAGKRAGAAFVKRLAEEPELALALKVVQAKFRALGEVLRSPEVIAERLAAEALMTAELAAAGLTPPDSMEGWMKLGRVVGIPRSDIGNETLATIWDEVTIYSEREKSRAKILAAEILTRQGEPPSLNLSDEVASKAKSKPPAPGPTKPRRSVRRCSERDEQFLAWANAGLDGYAIAAKWNKLHPTDNVSNEAVKKAIQRGRDK